MTQNAWERTRLLPDIPGSFPSPSVLPEERIWDRIRDLGVSEEIKQAMFTLVLVARIEGRGSWFPMSTRTLAMIHRMRFGTALKRTTVEELQKMGYVRTYAIEDARIVLPERQLAEFLA